MLYCSIAQITHPEMYVPLTECWNKVFPPPSAAARKSAASSPGGDSSKFIEGPASSTFEISFKDTNQPAQQQNQQQAQQAPQDVPKISRIRGSFGSLENATGHDSPSTMHSGATSASAATAPGSSGPFSAGFAFLTSMFPGSQQSGQQQAMTVMGSTSAAGRGGGASGGGGGGGYGGYGGGGYAYRNVSVAGGGYASLPVSDPTAHSSSAASAPPLNRPGPWSAQGFHPEPQQPQHQQHQHAALPQRAPTQFQYTQPPHLQHQYHQLHHQYHQPSYQQHQHQQHGEPMFSPQFASAINAIGAFTSSVSSSVFGSQSGPRAGYGGGYPAPSGNNGASGTTPSASMMSVNLEESFAV